MRLGATGSQLIRRREVRLRRQATAPRASQILLASPALTYVLYSCCLRDQTHQLYRLRDRHDRGQRTHRRHLGEERRNQNLRLHRYLHPRLRLHPDDRRHRGVHHRGAPPDDLIRHRHRRLEGEERVLECYLGWVEYPYPGSMRTGCYPGEEGVGSPYPDSKQMDYCRGEVRLASVHRTYSRRA